METRETNQPQLKFIGKDNAVRKALNQVIGALNPEALGKNISILTDTEDKYVIEALDVLKKDPEAGLIIAAIYGRPGLLDRNLHYLTPLMESPRVKVVDTLRLGDLLTAINGFGAPGTAKNPEQNVDPAILDTSIAVRQRALSVVQHDLRHAIKEKGPRYDQLIARARELLGAQPGVSDEEVIALVSASQTRIQKTEERDIPGVYCDIENTLVKPDGTLNMEIVDLIKKYIQKGKKVTVWTGGDLSLIAQKLAGAISSLESAGDSETACMLRNLDLVSKYDYAGARAETVIDDTLPEELFLSYGIRLVNFIRA